MDDKEIVALYLNREETAISATATKYGNYCYSIAYNILFNKEDAEESVNDTYLSAWNSIPPHEPEVLSAFLGKIVRNVSLKRWRDKRAQKRGNGELTLAYEELADCIPGGSNAETAAEEALLVEVLNRFLEGLPVQKRKIFLRRYWYMSSVKEIAADFGLSESNVKMTLLRLRSKLKQTLEKEGIIL